MTSKYTMSLISIEICFLNLKFHQTMHRKFVLFSHEMTNFQNYRRFRKLHRCLSKNRCEKKKHYLNRR